MNFCYVIKKYTDVSAIHSKYRTEDTENMSRASHGITFLAVGEITQATASMTEKVKERYVVPCGRSWRNWRTQRASAAKVLLKVTFTYETCCVLAPAALATSVEGPCDYRVTRFALYTVRKEKNRGLSLQLSHTVRKINFYCA